jgi:hypothetical protein
MNTNADAVAFAKLSRRDDFPLPASGEGPGVGLTVAPTSPPSQKQTRLFLSETKKSDEARSFRRKLSDSYDFQLT